MSVLHETLQTLNCTSQTSSTVTTCGASTPHCILINIMTDREGDRTTCLKEREYTKHMFSTFFLVPIVLVGTDLITELLLV